MAFSRFHSGIALRVGALFLTIAAVAWMIAHTGWYVTITLLGAAALAEAISLVRFSTQASREVARFLDAVAVDDTSQSFTAMASDAAHRELGTAMERVLARLRTSRRERDEQAQYLQILINHVPVALISTEEGGAIRLLNTAARRLFETSPVNAGQLKRYGEPFAVGLESLRPGNSAVLRMQRGSGDLLLKAAVTEISSSGVKRRLISLQNIDNEMNAQELAAWETVIRVMAHEVMNSLTPVSSLATTAHERVREVLEQLPAGDVRTAALADAHEALETVVRRSEGLLHFVRGHRRLTKPLAAQVQVAPVQRLFARIQRLLAGDLAGRDIHMSTSVEPETLELAMDPELLDQALINLVRNSIEALRDTPAGVIALTARRHSDGRIVISVADNGPGIPSEDREKVFVPFFTTKRQGSGIGLTLVRQIAAAHSATVDIAQTSGGGATVSLRF
jgi:two-component system, NtrC family, nitrogen regulation sensor histidine kinase NtrY